MYKAAFFDIDGTLLNNKGEILKSTWETIESLKKQNIVVGLATGRSKAMISSVLEKISFDTFVFLNGGYSTYQNTITVEFPITQNDLNKIVTIAKKHGHGLSFCGEHVCYLAQNSEMIDWALNKFDSPVMKYDGDNPQDIYAIWLNCPTEETEVYQHLENFIVEPWTGKEGMHDILLKNVSKLEGIQELVNKLGISIEETIAIGDGFNDIEMIKGVGLGIAMGNAPEEVKIHAKMITTSNNEDGIANAFKKLGLL